jgi:hypothetical protein
MNPARSETVRFLNVVMPPRVPARTPIVVRFTKLTGVKLEHTLAVDGGAFGANQAKLTFTQLTSDKIQNDLPLQATFVLQTRGSAGEESAVVCQPLSPASEEYRKVQEQRRRNIVERQYVRFAGTLQTHAEIHYRVFLNLQTHLVELGATDDAE